MYENNTICVYVCVRVTGYTQRDPLQKYTGNTAVGTEGAQREVKMNKIERESEKKGESKVGN